MMLNTSTIHEGIQLQPLSVLNVRVNRNPMYPSRYQWKVLVSDGRVIESSTQTYATEQEALREGTAAAREIRRSAI